jgi:GTPase Era involved in 16S rRNA processing
MMNFVYSALETADVLCLIIDATEKYGHGDEFVIETLKKVTTPLFLLINKVDVVRKDTILPIIDKYKDLLPFKEIIPISALKGTNLDVLEKRIYDFLPEAEKLYDDETVTDQTLRFQLAEIIREKLLKRVKEELPFVTAVLVDSVEERKDTEGPEEEQEGEGAAEGEAPLDESFEADVPSSSTSADTGKADRFRSEPVEEIGPGVKSSAPGQRHGPGKPDRRERPTKVTYVRASIFVEKDNQKGIVIGRNGRVIKEIGIDARREIEKILGSIVYLDLKVKVRERWRDSAEVLDLIEGQR